MGKSKGQQQAPTAGSSAGGSKEQAAAVSKGKNEELDAREGDQELLIGPRNNQPSVCSMAENSRKGFGKGPGERLKSSLKWQGSLQERDVKTPEGWRMSHSSVSSIYYSAQDISELMSVDTLSDWSSDQLSSFRSYHSVRDSLLFDKDSESDKDDDVFNSPQESPTCSGAPIHSQASQRKVRVAGPFLNITCNTAITYYDYSIVVVVCSEWSSCG